MVKRRTVLRGDGDDNGLYETIESEKKPRRPMMAEQYIIEQGRRKLAHIVNPCAQPET